MIEVLKDDFIAPEHIARVKKIDDDTCNMWLVGQSALEPHVVPCNAGELARTINEALGIDEDEDSGDEDEETDNG